MRDVRLSLPTVVAIVAVASAGAFAAGRAATPAAPVAIASAPELPPHAPHEHDDTLPPDHPPMPGANAKQGSMQGSPEGLPAGHPPVGAADPGTPGLGAAGAMGATPASSGDAPPQTASLEWKVPARWSQVPSASPMRLATYRVPRAAGDAEDPEMSVMQAGGTVEANADRWVGQFDAEGQKTAKRTKSRVGTLDVTIVEVQGAFAGGMGKDPGARQGWALLGAIVVTPGMPHFFKLTGPQKSVLAARADFDELLKSMRAR
jgi:hypothetical protein